MLEHFFIESISSERMRRDELNLEVLWRPAYGLTPLRPRQQQLSGWIQSAWTTPLERGGRRKADALFRKSQGVLSYRARVCNSVYQVHSLGSSGPGGY